MKIFIPVMKIIILGIIALGALALAWVYLIPGIALGLTKLDQRYKWLPAVTAFTIVAILRCYTGAWHVRIGEMSPGTWPVQMAAGIIQFAIAYIVVSSACRIPKYFIQGLHQFPPAHI
jgi:hypothetical protein